LLRGSRCSKGAGSKMTVTAEAPPVGLLTVAEAARVLRCSDQTIYNAVARGELPAIRTTMARKAPIRIDVDDLADYVARASRR
jgi:excisionase family DNA binding protein